MTILVTRPPPDNQRSRAALEAHGYAVMLAPVLGCDVLRFALDDLADFGGLIVTSANAARALAAHVADPRLTALPVFAVGDRSAESMRAIGFADVVSAGGDSRDLVRAVAAQFPALNGKAARHDAAGAVDLLYAAGEEVSRDLAAELAPHGIAVTTRAVYRMRATGALPDDVTQALSQGDIRAVLHYSRASARAFVAAARLAGVEISALALPQCCLSAEVAAPLTEAGAGRIAIAARPDEAALIAALAGVAPPVRPASRPA